MQTETIDVRNDLNSLRTNVLFRTSRALVVDDEHDQLDRIVAVMEGLDIETDTVDNGLDALDKASEEDYDIVTMDIRMQDFYGHRVSEILRCLNSTVPIIKVTAYARQHVDARYESRGMVLLHRKSDEDTVLSSLSEAVTLYRSTMDELLTELTHRKKFISYLGHVAETVRNNLFQDPIDGSLPDLVDKGDHKFESVVELLNGLIGLNYTTLEVNGLVGHNKPLENAFARIDDAESLNNYDAREEFQTVAMEIDSINVSASTALEFVATIQAGLETESPNNYAVDTALQEIQKALGTYESTFGQGSLLGLFSELSDEGELPYLMAEGIRESLMDTATSHVTVEYNADISSQVDDRKYDIDAARNLVGAANVALTTLLQYTTEHTDKEGNQVDMRCTFSSDEFSVGFKVVAPTNRPGAEYFTEESGVNKQKGLPVLRKIVERLGGTVDPVQTPSNVDQPLVGYEIKLPAAKLDYVA